MNAQTDTDATRRPAGQGGGREKPRGPDFDPRDPLHRAFGARVSRSFNRAGEETFVFVGSGEAASSEFRLAPRGERGLLEEALDLDLSRYGAGPPRRRGGGGQRWWEEGPCLFKVAYKEEAPAVETPEGKRAGMRLYLSGQPGEGERRANRKISVVVFGKEGFRPKAETEGGVRLDLLPLGARLSARVAVSREGFWKLMAARVRAGWGYIEGAEEELPPKLRLGREEEWDGAPLEGEPAPSELAIGTEKTGEAAREEEASSEEEFSGEESSGEESSEEASFGAGEESGEEAEDLAFAGDFGDGEAAAGGDGASFAEEAPSKEGAEPNETEAGSPAEEREAGEKGPAELLSADGEQSADGELSADGSSAADASAGGEPEKTESKPGVTEQAEQEKETEAELQEEKVGARDSGEEGEGRAPEAAEEEEEATPPPAGALRPDIDWTEACLLPTGGGGASSQLPTGHRDRKGRVVREGDIVSYPDGALRQVRYNGRMGLCFAGGRPYYEAGRRIGEPQVVARGFPKVPFRAHADVSSSSGRQEEFAAEKRLSPIPFGD